MNFKNQPLIPSQTNNILVAPTYRVQFTNNYFYSLHHLTMLCDINTISLGMML